MGSSGAEVAPWPAAVAGPAVVLVSIGVGWLVTTLGVAIALRRLRRASEESWVERSRMAFPARRVAGLSLIIVPLAVGAIASFRVAPGLGLVPLEWGVLEGFAGQFGAMIVGKGLERRLCWAPGDAATRRRGISLVALMLQPGLIPFGLMLALMPHQWGWEAGPDVAVGVALTTLQICGGWTQFLRWLGLARPGSRPRSLGLWSVPASQCGALCS